MFTPHLQVVDNFKPEQILEEIKQKEFDSYRDLAGAVYRSYNRYLNKFPLSHTYVDLMTWGVEKGYIVQDNQDYRKFRILI